MHDGTEQETYEWVPDEAEQGLRIDKFLAEAFQDREVSRSQIQQWIRDGSVRVNDRAVKPNYKLSAGDVVEMEVPETEETHVEPEPIPLDIVYEDGNVVVVNKPRGMVVHPAPGHRSGTLVNALLHHCRDLSGIGGERRPGIVHRIDKDTSGLIMAAKNDRAHQSLSRQLKDHSVERIYRAVVHGVPVHDSGTIDAPIGRHPTDRKKFTVTDKNGKPAVTHFAVLERFREAALLELKLETGRTHQIRVHMQFIGHPLVGDPVYSRNRRALLEGQALHAAVLGFRHPETGEKLRFEAPLPEDIEHLLRYFRSR